MTGGPEVNREVQEVVRIHSGLVSAKTHCGKSNNGKKTGGTVSSTTGTATLHAVSSAVDARVMATAATDYDAQVVLTSGTNSFSIDNNGGADLFKYVSP